MKNLKYLLFYLFLFCLKYNGISQNRLLQQKWKLVEFYDIKIRDSLSSASAVRYSSKEAQELVKSIRKVSNVKFEVIEFLENSLFKQYQILKSGEIVANEQGKLDNKNRMYYKEQEYNSLIIHYDKQLLVIGFEDSISIYIPIKCNISTYKLKDNYIFPYVVLYRKIKK